MLEINKVYCCKCEKKVATEDGYCRECGKDLYPKKPAQTIPFKESFETLISLMSKSEQLEAYRILAEKVVPTPVNMGWDCPSSPTDYCEYLQADGTYDEDCCIYCGEPEERK